MLEITEFKFEFVILLLSKQLLCKLFIFIDVSNLLILYCLQLVLKYCSAV